MRPIHTPDNSTAWLRMGVSAGEFDRQSAVGAPEDPDIDILAQDAADGLFSAVNVKAWKDAFTEGYRRGYDKGDIVGNKEEG